MTATFQRLQPTGHREVTSPEHPEQHTKAMPKDDANANKTFFGPAGLLKGSASGRNRTALTLNRTAVQTAGRFQKVRRSRK